jgi:tryptophan synthase beta subunit
VNILVKTGRLCKCPSYHAKKEALDEVGVVVGVVVVGGGGATLAAAAVVDDVDVDLVLAALDQQRVDTDAYAASVARSAENVLHAKPADVRAAGARRELTRQA